MYFFDTYLAGKNGWATGAHPGAQAYRRKVSYTCNSIISGAAHPSYWWVDWGSTGGASTFYWRDDCTYTSVPGDLCTYTSGGNSDAARTGEWTIWESGLDSDEFAVFNGREIWFYWPSTPKIMAWDDGAWDGTGTTHRGRTWLRPGGHVGSAGLNPGYRGGVYNNDVAYLLTPDTGFDVTSALSSGVGADFPIAFRGLQWSTTSGNGAGAASYPSSSGHPMIPRGPADTLHKFGGNDGNLHDYRWLGSTSATATILQDTNTSIWYIHNGTGIDDNCIMLDCGLTEPVLNA